MELQSGKRKRSSDFADKNRRRRSHFGEEPDQVFPMPDDTTYRVLCPVIRVGSVIGRGGDVIKQLRWETNARIKVLETIPGVDERVILIWSTAQDDERHRDREKRQETEKQEDETSIDADNGNKDGEKVPRDHIVPGKESFLCAAQAALFKVHEKMEEDERAYSRKGDADEDGNPVSPTLTEVTVRLLVPNSQIGCLLGKGGKVIEKMRNDTGAQIRVSSKDTLPGCALPTDELVQIAGDSVVVKKALYEISARIYENPLRDRPRGPGSVVIPVPMPHGGPLFPQPGGFPHMYGPPNLPGPPGGHVASPYGQMDPIAPWSVNVPPAGFPPFNRRDGIREQDFAIRMLCLVSRTGLVIGKAGSAIKILRDETGARIIVEDAVSESDERIIAISATEFYDNRSPVIEAALRLQVKMGEFSGDREITTRLLVPSKQIGCLLGKGGSVITEMRKKTTAGIKVLQKVERPKCAQETDELVQIIGSENIARQALIEVLTRLRNNVFRGQFADLGMPNYPPSPPYNTPSIKSGFGPPPSYLGRPDVSYPGESTYTSYNGRRQPGNLYKSSSTSAPHLQGTGSAYGGYLDMQNGPSPYNSRFPGDGPGLSNTPPTVPSNKFVEVTIPAHAVNSVLGKGSKNLASIREISGAKLKILEPNGVTGDRVAEIFGTPEQTQAAESLVRAFILSG